MAHNTPEKTKRALIDAFVELYEHDSVDRIERHEGFPVTGSVRRLTSAGSFALSALGKFRSRCDGLRR